MKNITRLLLLSVGLGGLIGFSIALYWTFLDAYFHGYKTVVAVNCFGEADFELFFIPVLIIIGVWSVCFLLKNYKIKKEK